NLPLKNRESTASRGQLALLGARFAVVAHCLRRRPKSVLIPYQLHVSFQRCIKIYTRHFRDRFAAHRHRSARSIRAQRPANLAKANVVPGIESYATNYANGFSVDASKKTP